MLWLAPLLLQLSSVTGPNVTGVYAFVLVHAVAGTRCCSCFLCYWASTVAGLHALALVHAVAGTLDVAVVSSVIGPLLLLASMLLPLSMLLLAPLLLRLYYYWR